MKTLIKDILREEVLLKTKFKNSSFKKINESSSIIDNLKKFLTKKWDEQKAQGKIPNFSLIYNYKLEKFLDELLPFYIEYMGYGDVNSRSQVVKQYLLNHTFTENEITEMKNYFDDGKIEVRFDNVEFTENEGVDLFRLNLDINFTVLSGSFYNSMEERVYNFSSEEDEFEDFVEYWEFKEAIEEVVESFIFETLEAFGYDTNDDFDYIKVKWD